MPDMTWLRAEYEHRKQNAERQVSEWHLYSDDAFDPRPFYYESHRYRRGRRLSPEKSSAARYRYGVDREGRAWVEHQLTQFPGQYYETFSIHGFDGPQEVAGFHHPPDKPPIFLDRLTYANGLLIGYEKVATQGCSRSRYVYSNDRLTRIELDAGSTLADLQPFQIDDVTFDALGRLEQIIRRQLGAGGREIGAGIRFAAKPRGLKTKDLKQIFLERLLVAVPETIRALSSLGTIYCLALAYDPGQFSQLPPMLGLGLVERLGDLAYEPWNPATMLQVELSRDRFPELSKAADLLDQGPISQADLRSLMNEGAGRLAELDWTSIARVTPDFVVYATDLELGDLVGNLRRVLSPERFAELKRSGSLPV